MPNWCSTSYTIEGPEDDLLKIQEAIKHPADNEDSSPGWEGDILNALGINSDNYAYMRGFITEEPTMNDNTLSFFAEEAWGTTDFDDALKEKFPNIKVYWSAEEPGMEIYSTNDSEGKYYPERFLVDACIEDEYYKEYFIKEAAAYHYIDKITKGKCKTEDDINKFNASAEMDDYISLYAINVC